MLECDPFEALITQVVDRLIAHEVLAQRVRDALLEGYRFTTVSGKPLADPERICRAFVTDGKVNVSRTYTLSQFFS